MTTVDAIEKYAAHNKDSNTARIWDSLKRKGINATRLEYKLNSIGVRELHAHAHVKTQSLSAAVFPSFNGNS